jgi:hypothetical protein
MGMADQGVVPVYTAAVPRIAASSRLMQKRQTLKLPW